MRFFLLIFVFIGVNAKFSHWKDMEDDDEEEEKELYCQLDSVHKAGKCKNHYYICNDRKKTIAHCPEGFVFYYEWCTYKEESPECPRYKSELKLYKSGKLDSACQRKVDGHYNFACENGHYSCKNGTITLHKCPEGLVYYPHSCSEDKCVRKEHNPRCSRNIFSQYEKPRCANATETPRTTTKVDSIKEFSCRYKRDGHYPAGRCLNHFNICVNFKQITGYCPEGMVFWKRQCRFRRDVEHCPEYKTDLELYHSHNETLKNSICEIRGDGFYHFPCENESYKCWDGKTIWSKCPDGEAYFYWFSCSKRVHHVFCPEFDDTIVDDIDPNEERRNRIGCSWFSIGD